MDIENYLKNQLGDGLELNIPIGRYTTLKVGGLARFFFCAKTVQDLTRVAALAIDLKIPYLVLGSGSEIVLSDRDFEGLVIKNETSNVNFGLGNSEVIVDSGVRLSTLINLAASRDLGGLEFAAGTDCTLGGAIYGNFCVSRKTIGDYVKSLSLLLSYNNEVAIKSMPGSWMQFGFNSSKLKSLNIFESKPLILTVRLQLVKRRKDEILRLIRDYSAKQAVGQQSDIPTIRNFFCDLKEGPDVLSVADFFSKCNIRSVKVGGASFSARVPNCMTNHHSAKASDVRTLADKVRDHIAERTGVVLRERIEYIGQWG